MDKFQLPGVSELPSSQYDLQRGRCSPWHCIANLRVVHERDRIPEFCRKVIGLPTEGVRPSSLPAVPTADDRGYKGDSALTR